MRENFFDRVNLGGGDFLASNNSFQEEISYNTNLGNNVILFLTKSTAQNRC